MQKNFLKTLTLLTTVCCLTGCMLLRPATHPSNTKLSWEQRQKTLNTITSWQAQGAIAVHDKTQAQSASLRWQQQSAENFAIRLFGPLGVGNTIILGKPGLVTLTNAQNKTFSAPNSAALLQQQTGWQLPIESLYYWVRGLPAPGDVSALQFDSAFHLTSFQQQGWSIAYGGYTFVQGIDLPTKVIMNRPPLVAKIILRRWKLG